MDLKPVSVSEFKNLATRNLKLTENQCLDFFENDITMAKKYAIGPHFWLIPDQSEMKVGACSPNIFQMTPFSHSEWLNQDFTFWLQNMHPEDREFAVASFALSMEVTQNTPKEKVEMIQINIYIRMLDCNNCYRWVLIQFPRKMYDEEGKVLSTFILITDLSHLQKSFSKMLTMMDSSNNENIIFASQVDNKNLISLNLSIISKRELEILQLMVRGLNSPQIAENLCISYHTVENHKRNLRKKTGTKTTAELIDFVWRNNLI